MLKEWTRYYLYYCCAVIYGGAYPERTLLYFWNLNPHSISAVLQIIHLEIPSPFNVERKRGDIYICTHTTKNGMFTHDIRNFIGILSYITLEMCEKMFKIHHYHHHIPFCVYVFLQLFGFLSSFVLWFTNKNNTWPLGISMCDRPGRPRSETQIHPTPGRKQSFEKNSSFWSRPAIMITGCNPKLSRIIFSLTQRIMAPKIPTKKEITRHRGECGGPNLEFLSLFPTWWEFSKFDFAVKSLIWQVRMVFYVVSGW